MGLIKSANAPVAAAPFSMQDIEAAAKAMLLRARSQADQLLAEAGTEGAKMRQKAYDAGFAAGREDGLRKGTEEGRATGKQAALAEHRAALEQLAKTLTAAVTEIDSSRTFLQSTAATEVVKLAVAIARRVTKLQGTLDPNVLTENVRLAMKLAVQASDVRIAIHPSQREALQQTLPLLKQEWPKVAHVTLVDDEKMSVGGCRIMTANGEVDADLEKQIDRVAADLLPDAREKVL